MSLEQEGFDDPLMTSETTLEGETGDIVKRLHWGPLEAGDYTVVSCIAPRATCARVRVAIQKP